jgi:hypothetical protein
MSNLKVRPKGVDFSGVNREYARAEITTKASILKMKSDLLHTIYENFIDDTRIWMRHSDIIKKEYKLREFDTMSPNGETKLLVYIEAWLSNMDEDELKDFYVDKVLEGAIPYYE